MSGRATTALTGLSATDLALRIRTREVSSVEAVEAHIMQIEEHDGALNAVVVRRFEEARREAAEADRGSAGGRPLHGVPVTVKECFELAGTPTTIGLVSLREAAATEDAELVKRLRGAGAIVVGKTNVSQLLIYVQ